MKELRREHVLESITCKITMVNQTYEIINEHILDLQIHWTLDNVLVNGSIIINDVLAMLDQDYFNGNATITLEYKDVFKSNYKETFYVYNIDQVREKGTDSHIKLYFNDETSRNLMKLYRSRGYTTTSINDILNEYFSLASTKKQNFSIPTILQNFAIPSNKSFLDTINYFKTKFNNAIFSRRTEIRALPYANIFGSGVDRSSYIKYRLYQENDIYYDTIYDESITEFDKYTADLISPVVRKYEVNSKNQGVYHTNSDFYSVYNELQIGRAHV